jgi:hypothetical protein
MLFAGSWDGAVTAIGMIIAIGVRRTWFIEILTQIPFIQRRKGERTVPDNRV